MTSTSLAQHFWPQTETFFSIRNLALAVAGTVLVALAAHISVPMLPVPMTLQTLAVLTIGAALGSRLGAATLMLYALEGAAGLPVFSPKAGAYPSIFGATGGYIIGFIFAAWLMGYLVERGWGRSVPKLFAAGLLSTALLYVPGLAWLATFIGAEKAITAGAVPFLAGDAIKAAIVALGIPAVWTLIEKR